MTALDDLPEVINAAGKLTALGGAAQSQPVAATQARWAGRHVDLAVLRRLAGNYIAGLTGAEAACVTTGAAAGIAISTAAILTGTDPDRARQVPNIDGNNRIILQAGHDINFGAPVEQMVRVGGGEPVIVGHASRVASRDIESALADAAALLYVQSHHCVQENRVSLEDCVALAHEHRRPVIVDAAAEEDLARYITAGADLVTYSGGKAFGGPTSGFIAGSRSLIEAAELQFTGFARSMKVGKETIAGLIAALEEFSRADSSTRLSAFEAINQALLKSLQTCSRLEATRKPDEAGRPWSRVAITARDNAFDVRDLVHYLERGTPSIRTRNHQVKNGVVLIDPRELDQRKADIVVDRLLAFDRQAPE